MGRPKIRIGNCINHPDKPIHARNLCRNCYRKVHYEEYEREHRGAIKHELHSIGTIRLDKDGYVRIKISIGNGSYDWMPYHRYVMEKKLSRKLYPFENVHHKYGDKTDNREESLELWITKQPKGQRVEDLIEYANWILETYKNNTNDKGTDSC